MFSIAIIIGLCVAAALAMSTGPQVRDAALKLNRALPASTSAVTSGSIDTGKSTSLGTTPALELLLTAPALSTAQLPDSKTMTYKIIHSDNSDLSSPADLYLNLIVQTGAGGVGAVGATKRVVLPSDSMRYFGFVITPSASGTGDASGVSATLEAMG